MVLHNTVLHMYADSEFDLTLPDSADAFLNLIKSCALSMQMNRRIHILSRTVMRCPLDKRAVGQPKLPDDRSRWQIPKLSCWNLLTPLAQQAAGETNWPKFVA